MPPDEPEVIPNEPTPEIDHPRPGEHFDFPITPEEQPPLSNVPKKPWEKFPPKETLMN